MIIKSNQNIAPHIPAGRVAVISDSIVAPIHGKQIADELGATLFTFPAGERNKSRETKSELEDALFAAGFGRDSVIVAVGGGVTTDLAGFIAATFCRGVPLVLVPTSLLAMADAAIGGKTGVNTPAGKNLVGATYQAHQVIVDPVRLETLPDEEFRNGLVEMIKHGLIADADHLRSLVDHAATIRDPDVITRALKTTCAIKQRVADEDEREVSGYRRILNFGHTVGHAIEQVLDYGIRHGRAVAIGMIVEGSLSATGAHVIINALDAFGIDTTLPQPLSTEDLWQAMCRDKKAANGMPRVTVLETIGKAAACSGEYCIDITRDRFEEAWQWHEQYAHV